MLEAVPDVVLERRNDLEAEKCIIAITQAD